MTAWDYLRGRLVIREKVLTSWARYDDLGQPAHKMFENALFLGPANSVKQTV